jgi:hypothetical protein
LLIGPTGLGGRRQAARAGRGDNFAGSGGSKAELGKMGRMPRRTPVAHESYIRLEVSLNPRPKCD